MCTILIQTLNQITYAYCINANSRLIVIWLMHGFNLNVRIRESFVKYKFTGLIYGLCSFGKALESAFYLTGSDWGTENASKMYRLVFW